MNDNVYSDSVYPDEEMMNMFPQVHKKMMPYIGEAIKLYGNEPLTEDSLNKMSQYVVRKSFAAEPPPQWHSERSLNDIAKSMVLIDLMDGDDDDYGFDGLDGSNDIETQGFFPIFPFFPFFFDGRGFRRRRFRHGSGGHGRPGGHRGGGRR